MNSEEITSLEQVETGHQVAMWHRGGHSYRLCLATVTHTTPKQIHTAGRKFWRKNGEEIGTNGLGADIMPLGAKSDNGRSELTWAQRVEAKKAADAAEQVRRNYANHIRTTVERGRLSESFDAETLKQVAELFGYQSVVTQ